MHGNRRVGIVAVYADLITGEGFGSFEASADMLDVSIGTKVVCETTRRLFEWAVTTFLILATTTNVTLLLDL